MNGPKDGRLQEVIIQQAVAKTVTVNSTEINQTITLTQQRFLKKGSFAS